MGSISPQEGFFSQTPSLRIPDRAAMLGRRPRIPRGPAFPGGRILPEHIPADLALDHGQLPLTGNSSQRATLANRPLPN